MPPAFVALTPFGEDLRGRPRIAWAVFGVFYGLAAATAAVAALMRGN
ncbi:MAG: hypothetical protein OXC11_08620 [Rhodospirillales bacterium]|nr:hypothetical protein [Rhodospirillales bacterium]